MTNVYIYPNAQPTSTLWFHDHALGITRLNVYAGLAAFYLIRDAYDTGVAGAGLDLPSGKYEVELAIQDRQFDTNGQWFFPAGEAEGLNGTPPNPETHPFWLPEFFRRRDRRQRQNLAVSRMSNRRRYRFRILNGCNARFLELKISRNASSDRPGPVNLADRHRWRFARRAGRVARSAAGSGATERCCWLPPNGPTSSSIFRILRMRDPADAQHRKCPVPVRRPARPEDQWPNHAVPGQFTDARAETRASIHLHHGQRCAEARVKPPAIVRLTNPDRGTIARGVTISRRRQLILVEVEGDRRADQVLGQQHPMGGQDLGAPADRLDRALGNRQPDRGCSSDASASGAVSAAEPAKNPDRTISGPRIPRPFRAGFIPGVRAAAATTTPRTPISRSAETRRSPRSSGARGSRPSRERTAGRTRSAASPAR